MELRKLNIVKLGRGYAWLDTGTHESLLDAGEFVRSIQHRQGLLIGCPEEIAYQKKFIDIIQLRAIFQNMRRLLMEPICGGSRMNLSFDLGIDDPQVRNLMNFLEQLTYNLERGEHYQDAEIFRSSCP